MYPDKHTDSATDSPLSDHKHHHAPPSEIEERVKRLETLLVEKNLVDPESLDLLLDTYPVSYTHLTLPTIYSV